MKYFRNRPLYYLRRLILTGIFLALAACTTSVPADNSKSAAGVIVFTNRTPFTVHLVRGSGRIDVAAIAPGESKEIPNTFDAAEDYYPLFDIPLTNSWQLSRLRPGNIDFYYRIDNQKVRQEIDINVPESFNDAWAYIIFINNSRSGGVSISRNTDTGRMTGINFSEAKSNVNAGETAVYRDNPQELKNLRLNPHNVTFGETAYRGGYVYVFFYDGNEVSQIDARPLTEVCSSAPMSVEFTGDNLSNAERMIIINAVTTALESYGVPLRIILPGGEASFGERIFYTMLVNLNIQIRPPQPPVNSEIVYADLSLTVLRSGKALRTVSMGNISEMFRSSLMNVLANRIREEAAFYQEIKLDISFQ